MWWPPDQNNKEGLKSGAASGSSPFGVRFESGLGFGLGVGLGLPPYLDPTRKCFLPRKREQPTAQKPARPKRKASSIPR